MTLAAIVDVGELIKSAGYPLLFVLVMAESGGVPLPGETALIVAAVLASQGKLDIVAAIGLAAAGAIVGDNIGYLIGGRGGRWLLQRPGPFHRQRLEVLAQGEPFFARHGPKAVFFGRFVLGLRTWASWLAGATHMRWRSFVVWNALGGICWALLIGVIAYYLGQSAENAISAFGIFGLVAVVILLVGLFALHRIRKHASDTGEGSGGGASGEGEEVDAPAPAGARGEGEDVDAPAPAGARGEGEEVDASAPAGARRGGDASELVHEAKPIREPRQ